MGEMGRALKEEEEEEEMRMLSLCTIESSRERSSISMRQEKQPAWNGGALEQHRRCRQHSHHLHSQSGCVLMEETESRYCMYAGSACLLCEMQ